MGPVVAAPPSPPRPAPPAPSTPSSHRYRVSIGRVNYALSVGDIRQIWEEIVSMQVAMTRHLAAECSRSEGIALADLSAVFFDTWLHSPARPLSVRRLVAFIDAMTTAHGVHASMRSYDTESLLGFTRLVAELSAAAGGDKCVEEDAAAAATATAAPTRYRYCSSPSLCCCTYYARPTLALLLLLLLLRCCSYY